MPKRAPVTPPLVALVVMLVVLATGCDAAGATPAADTPDPTAAVGLDGTTWTIASVGGVQLPADPPATLTVAADSSVTGTTGCNQLNGTASIDGSALAFGPLSTTRMACEPPLMEQERAVLDALAGVDGWSIDAEGRLHLTGASELVLTPAQP